MYSVLAKTDTRVDLRQNQVDLNDLTYAKARLTSGVHVVGWQKKFNYNFSNTTFLFSTGQKMSVFHVKPVYYVTKHGAVRPLSEIMAYHGNKTMVLKQDAWIEGKMDFAWLAWLMKRQALFGRGVAIEGQKIPVLLNTESTFYPNPNPETTSVDGHTQARYFNGSTWTYIRDLAGTAGSDISGVLSPNEV